MEKLDDTNNLTGDFDKRLSLPVEDKVSKNNDLNSISPSTVSFIIS